MKNFFERHRSFLSWIIVVPILFLLFLSPIPETSFLGSYSEYLGFFLLIIAAIGRIWTSLYICGKKDSELITEGPFSICRNPLYVFSFIGAVGLMLAGESLILAGLMVPIFWGYYHFVIKGEEQRLELLFGDEYKTYCHKTPRIVPKLSLYHSVSNIRIELKTMERSILDASCFLILIVMIEVLEQIKVH